MGQELTGKSAVGIRDEFTKAHGNVQVADLTEASHFGSHAAWQLGNAVPPAVAWMPHLLRNIPYLHEFAQFQRLSSGKNCDTGGYNMIFHRQFRQI
jgi:hypothetical protein